MPNKTEDLPFPIGQTAGGGGTVAATDFLQWEGKEYEVEINNPNSGDVVDPVISGTRKRVRAVRNLSGGTLAKKLLAKMKVDGSAYEQMTQVSGLTASVADCGYPIDEFLTYDVPANDLFYIVVNGLAKVTSDASGDTNISIGSYVVPGANGKVVDQDVSVVTATNIYNQMQNAVGRAVTAVNGINTDFYIDVRKH